MTFGEILKTRRLQKNMTQSELANKVFSTVTAISQFEHNKHMPKTDMVYSLADALEIPVEVLLFVSSDVIKDIDVSDNMLLLSEDIFGYIPDSIALTDVSEHKYRSLKMWNPDYTYDQFLLDILYPYVKKNPDMRMNLIRAYGKRSDMQKNVEDETESIEAQEKIPEGQELILSKTIRRDTSKTKNNVLIFASPRTGVHRSIVIPNILNLDMNFVVTDFRGEMYCVTKEKLKEKGYNVKTLILTNECHFAEEADVIYCNPFLLCDTVKQAANLVDAMLQTFAYNNDMNAIQYETMRGFLESTLNIMRKDYPKEKWGIMTWLEVIDNITSQGETNENYKLLNAISNDVYASACMLLQSYTCVIDETKNSNFDLNEFLQSDKHALFIHFNPYDTKYNAMNVSFLQAYIAAEKSIECDKLPTMYVIDEIENIGKMAWLPEEITTSQTNIFLCLAHTIHGLRTVYGKICSDMMINTMNIVLAMATPDFETNEFISTAAGVITLDSMKYKYRGWKKCTVPVLDVSQIMCLNNDECAIIIDGGKAIIDKVYDY